MQLMYNFLFSIFISETSSSLLHDPLLKECFVVMTVNI